MTKPIDFIIPLGNLKIDVPKIIAYSISQTYFDCLQIDNAVMKNLDIEVTTTKKTNFLLLHLSLFGSINSICDRCTNAINVQLLDEMNLIVKMVADQNSFNSQGDDPDIIYINFNATNLDINPCINDIIYLSIPELKKCAEDEKGKSCNQDFLNKYVI